MADWQVCTDDENRARALRGELYYAFRQDISAARARCKRACQRYNEADAAGGHSRREMVKLWRDIVCESGALPESCRPSGSGNVDGSSGSSSTSNEKLKEEEEQEDERLLFDEPMVEGPIRIDYGTNLSLGRNVYINFNCTILDTCQVTIGSRTLLGPNVSIYAATHPLDPVLRNGTRGPESGGKVVVGNDCFIGGSVVILPNVTIGDGSTIGAGSVVSHDIPTRAVAVGNPARVIKTLGPTATPD